MAIYDFDQDPSQVFNSIELFVGQSPTLAPGSHSRLQQLTDMGEYQKALELLKDRSCDNAMLNAKAVLLMRTGKPGDAAILLRPHVWDPGTFTLIADVPDFIRLNFATALLMTGRVAGAIEVIRSIQGSGNEQAMTLLNAIRVWEKSLSIFGWLDWKICGIEHVKKGIPVGSDPGRFGWEPISLPSGEPSATESSLSPRHHGLAG